MSINPPNRNQPRIVRSHGRTDGNLASSKDPEAPAIKRSIREVRDARVIGLWPANTHSGPVRAHASRVTGETEAAK